MLLSELWRASCRHGIGSMKLPNLVPLLRIAISLGLLAWLYKQIDLAQLRDVFAQTRVVPLVLLYALLLLNTSISAFKWKQILKADGSDVPLLELLGSYLVGGFLSLFLPSNIGGDSYRVYHLAQRSQRTGHSLASVLADRLSGLVVLVAFSLIVGLIGIGKLPSPRVLWIPTVAAALLALILGCMLHRNFTTWCLDNLVPARWGRLRRLGQQLLDSVEQYRRTPGTVARMISLSILFHFNVCFSIFVLAQSLSMDTPFIAFLTFVPFISLLEALPISIFGLGIRDNAYVYFFTMAGMTTPQAAAMALAYFVTTLTYSLSGGLILALRKSRLRTG
jgi:uncharacterized protein (TIRG00374 family)